MKLVTKFLTTDASIYFYLGKFVILSNGKIIFSSISYEMCVGVSINRQELSKLEMLVSSFSKKLVVETLIYT